MDGTFFRGMLTDEDEDGLLTALVWPKFLVGNNVLIGRTWGHRVKSGKMEAFHWGKKGHCQWIGTGDTTEECVKVVPVGCASRMMMASIGMFEKLSRVLRQEVGCLGGIIAFEIIREKPCQAFVVFPCAFGSPEGTLPLLVGTGFQAALAIEFVLFFVPDGSQFQWSCRGAMRRLSMEASPCHVSEGIFTHPQAAQNGSQETEHMEQGGWHGDWNLE